LRGIVVDPKLVALAIDEFPILFIAAAAARARRSSAAPGAAKKETAESRDGARSRSRGQ
jgi:hypothetical protein